MLFREEDLLKISQFNTFLWLMKARSQWILLESASHQFRFYVNHSLAFKIDLCTIFEFKFAPMLAQFRSLLSKLRDDC